MKKVFAITMAVAMLLAVLCVSASAFTLETASGTVYDVISPKEISFSWVAGPAVENPEAHEALVVGQGGSTLEALIDGDPCVGVSAFSTKGIVLIKDTYVAPTYTANGNAMCEQAKEDLTTFSFALDFGAETSFDTVYCAVYSEINSDIGIPGDKQVIVETSKDGISWLPVGTTGNYYFNLITRDYTGEQYGRVDECDVYLGKAIKSRYVKLSFTFDEVPEDGYWRWYNNTSEWCGFTELGVANYKSGKKPEVLTDIPEDPTAVEGSWIGDDGENVYIYDFTDTNGKKRVNIMTFDASEYGENGLGAELKAHDISLPYDVLGTNLTIQYSKKNIKDIEAVIDEDGSLILGEGKNAVAFTAYEEPEKVALRGEWMLESEDDDGHFIQVWDIDSVRIKKTFYDFDAWTEKGFAAEEVKTETSNILLRGDILTILGKKDEDFRVVLNEDGSVKFDGENAIDLAVKKDPVAEEPSEEPIESQDESEAGDDSVEESAPAEESKEESAPAEESKEESAPAEESKDVPADESKDAPAEKTGFPVWAWIVIGVAAAAIIAVVVIIIVKKKK